MFQTEIRVVADESIILPALMLVGFNTGDVLGYIVPLPWVSDTRMQ